MRKENTTNKKSNMGFEHKMMDRPINNSAPRFPTYGSSHHANYAVITIWYLGLSEFFNGL